MVALRPLSLPPQNYKNRFHCAVGKRVDGKKCSSTDIYKISNICQCLGLQNEPLSYWHLSD